MIRSPEVPRLDLVSLAELDDDLRQRTEEAISTTTGAANLYLTLAHHPGLARRYLPFAGKLLAAGKLAVRARELAILRTAVLCGCSYEWGQHERIALDVGMSLAEIRSVAAVAPIDWPDAAERCLLIACDELVTEHCIAPNTWDDLVTHYGEIGTIELTMLVGNYAMLAGLLNSADVAREEGVPGLPVSAIKEGKS